MYTSRVFLFFTLLILMVSSYGIMDAKNTQPGNVVVLTIDLSVPAKTVGDLPEITATPHSENARYVEVYDSYLSHTFLAPSEVRDEIILQATICRQKSLLAAKAASVMKRVCDSDCEKQLVVNHYFAESSYHTVFHPDERVLNSFAVAVTRVQQYKKENAKITVRDITYKEYFACFDERGVFFRDTKSGIPLWSLKQRHGK